MWRVYPVVDTDHSLLTILSHGQHHCFNLSFLLLPSPSSTLLHYHFIMSDDENLDSNQTGGTPNVFSYQKKSFQSKRVDSDDSDDSDDDDMLTSKPTKTNILKRLDEEDDDDDDSDVEITTTTTIDAQTKVTYLMDDDDESDDDDVMIVLPKENLPMIETLRKARQARARLENAQRYHAEDMILCDDDEGILDIDLPSAARNLGSKLSIVIQSSTGLTQTTIRKLEPLQKVVDRLRVEFGIKKDTTIILEYPRHQELDLTKTPATYNIPVGAIVQLLETKSETAAAAPLIIATTTTTQQQGPLLKLKLRTVVLSVSVSSNKKKKTNGSGIKGKSQDDYFSIRAREPFSKLVELYKKEKKIVTNNSKNQIVILSFEGDTLELQQTPEMHDMEDDEIIEVTVK